MGKISKLPKGRKRFERNPLFTDSTKDQTKTDSTKDPPFLHYFMAAASITDPKALYFQA